jgi:type I restriction enzyme S subunit
MKLVKRRLGDIAQIVGGATPSTKTAEYWDGDIPWITPKDLSGFDQIYIENGSRDISQIGMEKSSVKILPAGTVLYTSRAPIGYIAIARVPVTTNQGFKSLVLHEGFVPEFVYYLLKNSKSEIESHSSGGTFAEISARALAEVELEFPDERHQSAIAEVLINLDRKILTNKSMSKTLEDILQSVFRSWFIDFDPVKAKMVGDKPVGMDDVTAAMFPNSMTDSEFGPIPSGWKMESLSDIGEFRNGLAMQKFPVVDVGNVLPVIKIAQLRAGNTSGADLASGLIDPKFVVSDGDVLFSWSGTLEIEHWAGGPGALNQHLFKVLGKTVPDWFIFSSSRSHLPEFRKIASGKATTMGHIQRTHLNEAKVAVPPVELLEEVDGLLSALVAQKVSLLVENRTLAELRDALLPRLISGELQIPEEMLVS